MNLTVPAIARLLQVSERVVERWIAEGLPATPVYGEPVVHRADLFDWTASRGRALSERLFPTRAPVDLRQALALGGVHRVATPADRRGCSEAVVAALSIGQPDAVTLVAGRPALGFLPVREGVAVPSARAPIVATVPPTVAVCRFETSLAGHGLDAVTVVAVAAPTVLAHRALTEAVVAALHDDAFRGPFGLEPVRSRAA